MAVLPSYPWLLQARDVLTFIRDLRQVFKCQVITISHYANYKNNITEGLAIVLRFRPLSRTPAAAGRQLC